MKKEKVINQPAFPSNKFIVVHYFKWIDTVMNTPCTKHIVLRSDSSVGIWKVKSLKN